MKSGSPSIVAEAGVMERQRSRSSLSEAHSSVPKRDTRACAFVSSSSVTNWDTQGYSRRIEGPCAGIYTFSFKDRPTDQDLQDRPTEKFSSRRHFLSYGI